MTIETTARTHTTDTSSATDRQPEPAKQPEAVRLPPGRALRLPLAFALGLVAFTLLYPIRQNAALLWSFLGAAAALMIWNAILFVSARRAGRTLTLTLGFAAKELLRWDKDGRRAHIFNPSSFPLAVFSLALIFTGTSDITWGHDIAITQFFPPHMYLMLFLIGLPGQFFFGVTSMTMSAVVTTYLFGLFYYAATGIYFFYDSYIPIAVFLGMHLLFSEPSTSPRTALGRVMFGALYGLSTVVLYQLLGRLAMPTFYDKLLQVPILNLSIRLIDRAARSRPLRRFDPAAL